MDIYEFASIIDEKKKFFQSSNEEIKNENITVYNVNLQCPSKWLSY